uniref:EF-hand domain-containing protein n=1 Tax=Gongylonema pulchrum TaxID=637853 RepID=A0A183D5B8_9BILA
LNNLKEFTAAVRLYTLANIPVSQMEFRRVVRASTGHNLNENLVKLLFRIFDTNNDDRLSYTEFIGVMNDRVRRGFKETPLFYRFKDVSGWISYKVSDLQLENLRKDAFFCFEISSALENLRERFYWNCIGEIPS